MLDTEAFSVKVTKGYDIKEQTRKLKKENDKHDKMYSSPILYKDDLPSGKSRYDLYVLTEYHYGSNATIESLAKYIHATLHNKGAICILSCLPMSLQGKPIRGRISSFYANHAIDLSQYIPPYSKVAVEGRAIYAVTKTDDINVQDFYDVVFNPNSHFYDPKTRSFYFPFDRHTSFATIDKSISISNPPLNFKKNWEARFARKQFIKAYRYVPDKIRYPKTQAVEITDTHAFFEEHKNEKYVAWDTETSSLNPFIAKIKCLTMAFDSHTGYYLKWSDIDKKELGEFLRNKFQIGSNLKYDINVAIHNGVDRDCLHIDWDTVNAGHVLNEDRRNGLKSHAWLYTRIGGYDRELDAYKKRWHIPSYDKIPHSVLMTYAPFDATTSFAGWECQSKQMDWIDNNPEFSLKNFFKEVNYPYDENDLWNLRRYYTEIVLPATNKFINIEQKGFVINLHRLRKYGSLVEKEMEKVREIIYQKFEKPYFSIQEMERKKKLAKKKGKFGFREQESIKAEKMNNEGLLLNIDSASELGKFLTQGKGWRVIRTGKSGEPLTGKDILREWAKEGHEEATLLLEYRQLKSWYNTFLGDERKFSKKTGKNGTGIWQYLQPIEGRDDIAIVHPTFAPMLAKTGRGRSSDPNMQNIPHHGDIYSQILVRGIFDVPSEDFVFGEEDGSGLQLRIEAAMSLDEELRKGFVEYGGDPHSVTAQYIYMPKCSLEDFMANKKEEPYKTFRFLSKGANFSLIFNTTASEFARKSLMPNWTIQQCEEYLKENGLENDPIERLSKLQDTGDFSKDLTFCKYWSAAINIKRKFFEKYPQIKDLIVNTIKFANKHGYIRSPFGAIKRLPQLLSHNDEDMEQGIIKHLHNIAVNAGVQNFESVLIMRTIIEIMDFIEENNMKSYVIGYVHDSIVRYVHKDEDEVLKKKIQEIFSKDISQNNKIPMEIDFSTYDVYHGDVWGIEKEELEKWKEENPEKYQSVA